MAAKESVGASKLLKVAPVILGNFYEISGPNVEDLRAATSNADTSLVVVHPAINPHFAGQFEWIASNSPTYVPPRSTQKFVANTDVQRLEFSEYVVNLKRDLLAAVALNIPIIWVLENQNSFLRTPENVKSSVERVQTLVGINLLNKIPKIYFYSSHWESPKPLPAEEKDADISLLFYLQQLKEVAGLMSAEVVGRIYKDDGGCVASWTNNALNAGINSRIRTQSTFYY